MVILLRLFVILAFCACVVKCGEGYCVTPNDEDGRCIPFTACHPLVDITTKKNITIDDILFLKRSKCEAYVKNRELMCCPESAFKPKLQDIPCQTPGGLAGKCIKLNSCPHLTNLLRPPTPQRNYDYLIKSRCEGHEKHSVCCGPPPKPSEVVILGNCPDQMSAFPPGPETQCCGGESRVGNKIVMGTVTALDEYPWLVMIEYIKENTKYLNCGGTLISGKYVLTAGHCLVGPQLAGTKPVSVRLGDYDIFHDGPDCIEVEAGGRDCTDGVTRIGIEKIIPYPDYNPMGQKRHDIGLIRLKEMAPYTDFIRPICLPHKDLTARENIPDDFALFTAGWGAVNSTQKYSKIKMHVELPYVNQSECQKAYTNRPDVNITLWRGQLCAGGDGRDACRGDSGGPLMYNTVMYFQIVGIVSFGQFPCGRIDTPGVYTKVYHYINWIKSTIVE